MGSVWNGSANGIMSTSHMAYDTCLIWKFNDTLINYQERGVVFFRKRKVNLSGPDKITVKLPLLKLDISYENYISLTWT